MNIEQIIPAKDIDEYTIRLANKGKYEIEAIEKEPNFNPTRRKFWVEVINAINASESNLYQNISPSDKTWISATSGVNGLKLGLTATRNYARAAFDIDTSNRVKNKQIFEQLELQKGEIERDFGESLTWESLDKNRGCRIKCEQRGDIFDEEQWPKMIAFMVNAMVRMENVFKPRLQSLSNKLG